MSHREIVEGLGALGLQRSGPGERLSRLVELAAGPLHPAQGGLKLRDRRSNRNRLAGPCQPVIQLHLALGSHPGEVVVRDGVTRVQLDGCQVRRLGLRPLFPLLIDHPEPDVWIDQPGIGLGGGAEFPDGPGVVFLLQEEVAALVQCGSKRRGDLEGAAKGFHRLIETSLRLVQAAKLIVRKWIVR